MKCEVSVIVPVYNVEKYLRRCIDSILLQTFKDFELILVDDGSPDNCGKICDEYAKKDKRIIVIHKENGGLSDARNSGIDWALNNSNSEWITFIDSDDWVACRYLEILINSAKKYNIDVSVCDFFRTSEFFEKDLSKKIYSIDSFQKWKTDEFFIKKNVNATIACGKIYKKTLFFNERYPKGKVHEDEFTTYKILFQCDYIVFVNMKLYYYFINPNSITQGRSDIVWNSKKIDFISAMEERMEYFTQKNLNNVFEFQLKQYCYYLCEYCKLLDKIPNIEDKKKYLPYFRKKLRKFIRENKKALNISFKNDKWIYELAYPKLLHIYWLILGKFGNK